MFLQSVGRPAFRVGTGHLVAFIRYFYVTATGLALESLYDSAMTPFRGRFILGVILCFRLSRDAAGYLGAPQPGCYTGRDVANLFEGAGFEFTVIFVFPVFPF